MAMNKAQKQQAVDGLKETFTTANTVVVAHYHGLSVDDMNALRAQAREGGARIKVAKNRLAKIATSDTKFDGINDMLTGPTALAFSEDAVAAAKAVVAYANENETLTIIGGAVDGKVLDEAGVKALAKTPSIDESRAKIVGLLQAAPSKLVSVLQAPGGQVARVVGARGSQSA